MVTERENQNLPDNDLLDDAAPPQEDGAQHARLTIKRLLPNRRIDKYLHHRFSDFSRTVIQQLISEQAVTVNGLATKNSYQLNVGDCIDMILPPAPTHEITPEQIPLDILYEDDHMLVLSKQANLIVHPARGNRQGTLVNGLVHYSHSLSSVNGNFRPGIVHRLDRDTTGVMVVAKTDTAHWRLAHQFEHRQVTKRYMAVVHGTLGLDADVIKMPLGRHLHVREKYAPMPESGKAAQTRYEVVRQYRGYALLNLFPKTGRTHQLRVHMSLIKHPIVSDVLYGGKAMQLGQLADEAPLPTQGEPGGKLKSHDHVITRQALHAAQLDLRHPATGKQMSFEAKPPEDFELLVKLLDRYRLLR